MQTFEVYSGQNVDHLPKQMQRTVAKIMKLRTVTKTILFAENEKTNHLVILFSHHKITPKCTSILSKIEKAVFGLSEMLYTPDNKKMRMSLITKKPLLN